MSQQAVFLADPAVGLIIMTQAAKYAAFLENLTPENLPELRTYLSPGVRFSDPFHDVQGAEKMIDVFEDMFKKAGPVTFDITSTFEVDGGAIFEWDFSAKLFGQTWSIPGVTIVKFDEHGKVTEHRDIWDSGKFFLARIPVIGRLVSRIYRRAAAPRE